MRRVGMVAVVSVLMCLAGPFGAGAATYTVSDVGPVPQYNLVTGLNDAGVVVGNAVNPVTQQQEGYWFANGQRHFVDVPQGMEATAVWGVSNAGVMAGEAYAQHPAAVNKAYTWSPSGVPTAVFPNDPAGASSQTFGISDDGAVIAGPGASGYFVRSGQTLYTFPTYIGPGSTGGKVGVSNAAEVVGYYRHLDDDNAYYWSPGTGGVPVQFPFQAQPEFSYVNAISNTGLMVGNYSTPSPQRGYLMRTDGSGLVQFDPFTPGATFDATDALDVNDAGWVVGTSWSDVTSRAFLWTPAGGMVDLNTLIDPASGWTLLTAEAVNDTGWIAGTGLFGGEQHAYLLAPAPEPASLAVIGLGAVGLLRRRRP